MGVGTERHAPAVFPPEKRPSTHCTGGWVGLSDGLDECGISRPLNGIRSPARPAHSEALYRQRYPGPKTIFNTVIYLKTKCLLKLAAIFKEKSHSRSGRFTPGKELSLPEVPEPVWTFWRR